MGAWDLAETQNWVPHRSAALTLSKTGCRQTEAPAVMSYFGTNGRLRDDWGRETPLRTLQTRGKAEMEMYTSRKVITSWEVAPYSLVEA